MAVIRPCADLRNNYNEISKICHETKEPIYITKNGSNDLVILSDEAYESIKKEITESTEEKIDRLISEKFNKYYSNFEEFQKEVWKNKEITESTEEKIDRLISEKFNKYYSNFEEFQKEVWKNIEVALSEIDSGKAITMEKALAELEAQNETN